MNGARILRAAVRPWKGLFFLNAIIWTAFHSIPLLFGLAVGWTFRALEGDDPSGVAVALGRVRGRDRGPPPRLRGRRVLLLDLLASVASPPASQPAALADGGARFSSAPDEHRMRQCRRSARMSTSWANSSRTTPTSAGSSASRWPPSPSSAKIDARLTAVVILPMLAGAVITRITVPLIRRYREADAHCHRVGNGVHRRPLHLDRNGQGSGNRRADAEAVRERSTQNENTPLSETPSSRNSSARSTATWPTSPPDWY